MKTVDAYHHAKQWAGNILNAPNKWHPMQHLSLIILYV